MKHDGWSRLWQPPLPGEGADELRAHDGLMHAVIYGVDVSDPASTLIDRTAVAPENIRQIAVLMGALGDLREAEQLLSRASCRYMRLNETDMCALHYLIVCENR